MSLSRPPWADAFHFQGGIHLAIRSWNGRLIADFRSDVDGQAASSEKFSPTDLVLVQEDNTVWYVNNDRQWQYIGKAGDA